MRTMRSMRRLIWPKRQICSGIELRLRRVRVVGSGTAAIRSPVVSRSPPGFAWINGCWDRHGGRLGLPAPVPYSGRNAQPGRALAL